MLQIIGDEEIYGEQVIVEASDEGDEVETDEDGKGNSLHSITISRKPAALW